MDGPPVSHQGTRSSRHLDLWAVTGLLLLGVALPLVVSAIAGSLEIPRNDDWSYRHIAIDLAQTGRFALDGISETMIVGQILFVQPFLWLFGLGPWAFTMAGTVFAIGGILSAYAVARQLLTSGKATLAAALLALIPGYLAYDASFMSDVPALAAQFLCLTMGAIAIRHRPIHIGWLLGAAAMGVVGFSVREFALAAPASVMAAALVADRGRPRAWFLAIAVAACGIGIHLWHAGLAGQLPPVGPGYGSFSQSTQALSSVAFVVVPAALVGATRWRHHIRRFDLLIGLELGLVLAGARLIQWVSQGEVPPVILDNLASQFGVPTPAILFGGRPLLFDEPVWIAVNVLAICATVIVLAVGTGVAGTHLRRCRGSLRVLIGRSGSPAGILVLFSLAVAGGLFAFGLSRPVFDRYFWVLIPPVATLFMFVPGDLAAAAAAPPRVDRRSSRAMMATAMLFTVVLGVISTTYLFNAHSFDAARWSGGQRLVETGLATDEIDAGYEWLGYYATTQGHPTNPPSSIPSYRDWWPAFTPCGVVSSMPIASPGYGLIGTIDYQLNLVVGPTKSLYLYRITSADCPP